MRRRLELRDLRSLERRSMYSIFHPLDPNERLPRELLMEEKRWRRLSGRDVDLVAAMYLPALIVIVVVLGSLGVNMLLAFGVAGLVLAAFFFYVLKVRFR